MNEQKDYESAFKFCRIYEEKKINKQIAFKNIIFDLISKSAIDIPRKSMVSIYRFIIKSFDIVLEENKWLEKLKAKLSITEVVEKDVILYK